jgi:hypothetical protein
MPAWCTDCRAAGVGFPTKQNAAAGQCRIFIDGQPWKRAYYAVKCRLIGGILAAFLATAFA